MGREPENEEVVTSHVKSKKTLQELRTGFLNSAEFQQRVLQSAVPRFKTLAWPKIAVDVDVANEPLARMMQRVEQNFRYLGENEPHWSVITDERYRAKNIGANEREFFLSGKGVVNEFVLAAQRCSVALPRPGTCFELGCGLGRSTIWLADLFGHVLAADISKSHLRLAVDALGQHGKTNVGTLCVNAMQEFERLPAFDAFFSIIVLQHNPPPLMHYMLRNILCRLRPGGLGYFQVPTYQVGYEFNIDTYLGSELQVGTPEMHVFPQAALVETIERAGCWRSARTARQGFRRYRMGCWCSGGERGQGVRSSVTSHTPKLPSAPEYGWKQSLPEWDLP